MGADPAQPLREIAATRGRIDAELDALEASLPAREDILRTLTYAALGGAVVVLSLWFLGHHLKVRHQERRLRRLVGEAIRETEPLRARGG